MNEKKTELMPVQYVVVQNHYDDDEIDLKDLIKTILKYKKFIFIFTIIFTIASILYVYMKRPIYEVKANIQAGYINSNMKKYFFEPASLVIYINNKFDHSNNPKVSYPRVKAELIKHTNDLIKIQVDAYSNLEAINYLNNILKDIHEKENSQINEICKFINEKIKILKDTKKSLLATKQDYLDRIKLLKDALAISSLSSAILSVEEKIVAINKEIIDLKYNISPVNIVRTNIIEEIHQSDNPVRPKKKLIVMVTFITSFILSIFLVFFIEFIKGIKQEDSHKK